MVEQTETLEKAVEFFQEHSQADVIDTSEENDSLDLDIGDMKGIYKQYTYQLIDRGILITGFTLGEKIDSCDGDIRIWVEDENEIGIVMNIDW